MKQTTSKQSDKSNQTVNGFVVFHKDNAGYPDVFDSGGPWFYEPENYQGNDQFSEGYPTKEAAIEAAKASTWGVEIPEPEPTYEARMEGASLSILANDLEDAIEQAEEWARGGSWDTSAGTIYAHAYLIKTDVDGEQSTHSIKVQIDPEEPACIDREDHDWQSPLEIVGGIKENPGVYGHGGGVTIQEVCMRCGCGKLTDTWAQDPETGEQGLRSVTYEPDKYADQIEQPEDAE